MSHALNTGFDRRRDLMVACLVLGALDLVFVDGVALPRVTDWRSSVERPPPQHEALLPRAAAEARRGRPSFDARRSSPTIVPTPALELTVHFAPADASLGGRAGAAIEALAARAAAHPGWTFVVSGHADTGGDETFNARLSELRTATVAARLEAAGVPASRLQTLAFGAARPLGAGDDPRSRRLNRRVEIFVVRGGP